MVDPPKPRFSTERPGKSAATLVQFLMEELPTKTTPPRGGGLARSDASNARISGSKRVGSSAGTATVPGLWAATGPAPRLRRSIQHLTISELLPSSADHCRGTQPGERDARRHTH